MIYKDEESLKVIVVENLILYGYSILKAKHSTYFGGIDDKESLGILFSEAFKAFEGSVQKYMYFVSDKTIIEVSKEFSEVKGPVSLEGYVINILHDVGDLFKKKLDSEDMDTEIGKVSDFFSKERMEKIPLSFSNTYRRVFKVFGEVTLEGDINSLRDLDVILPLGDLEYLSGLSFDALASVNNMRDFKYLGIEYISLYAASYLATYFNFSSILRSPYSFHLGDNSSVDAKVSMLDIMDYMVQANIAYSISNGLDNSDLLPLGTYSHLLFSRDTNFVDLVCVMQKSGIDELVSLSKEVQKCLGISESSISSSLFRVVPRKGISFKDTSLARVFPLNYDGVINLLHGDPLFLESSYDFKELRMFKLNSISFRGLDCISDNIKVPVLFNLNYSRLFTIQKHLPGLHIFDILLATNQYLCDKTLGDIDNIFHNAMYYNKSVYLELSKSLDITMLNYVLPLAWLACGYGMIGLKSLINFIEYSSDSEDSVMQEVSGLLRDSLVREVPVLKDMLGG